MAAKVERWREECIGISSRLLLTIIRLSGKQWRKAWQDQLYFGIQMAQKVPNLECMGLLDFQTI